jgi:uncharacterized membrane protein
MTLFQLALYFVIASIIGWHIDTAIRCIRRRRTPIRKIPFSPLYGVASLTLRFMPSAVREWPWYGQHLYFATAFSLVEYVAGVLILAITGKRIWDYRDRFMNLQGHVDVQHFFLWGAVGLVGMRVLDPLVMRLIGAA